MHATSLMHQIVHVKCCYVQPSVLGPLAGVPVDTLHRHRLYVQAMCGCLTAHQSRMFASDAQHSIRNFSILSPCTHPMRYARSTAWLSTLGFQLGSMITTRSAASTEADSFSHCTGFALRLEGTPTRLWQQGNAGQWLAVHWGWNNEGHGI